MNGQTTPESSGDKTIWQTFKYDMGSVGKGTGYAFSRPTKWKGKQWIEFAGIATGTALLTLADDEIDHWSDGFRNDIPNSVLDFGGHSARPEGNYGLSSAVYFTGLFITTFLPDGLLFNFKIRKPEAVLIALDSFIFAKKTALFSKYFEKRISSSSFSFLFLSF